MKKVGIITLYDIKNYGNRLQAYALYRVIKKLNCEPVEIIHYEKGLKAFLKKNIKRNRFLTVCSQFIIGILRGNKLKKVIKKCNRLNLFSVFTRKIKSKTVFSDNKKIDYYVCGSDQIWNPNFAGQSSYFAAFSDKEKRISYAASFGISELPEKVIDRFKKNLNDMKAISVREAAGAKIVKELTGRDALVAIDPTLMLDKKDWEEVAKKPEFDIPEKYILVYFLGEFEGENLEYVEKLAEENNMKVILLNLKKENDYWYSTGPSEFIWLIENASLVCTDSFHASVFSILMETPFVAFKRVYKDNDMNSRFETLLGMFGLTDRFIGAVQTGEEFKTDYSQVSEILNKERQKSLDYLTDALEL